MAFQKYYYYRYCKITFLQRSSVIFLNRRDYCQMKRSSAWDARSIYVLQRPDLIYFARCFRRTVSMFSRMFCRGQRPRCNVIHPFPRCQVIDLYNRAPWPTSDASHASASAKVLHLSLIPFLSLSFFLSRARAIKTKRKQQDVEKAIACSSSTREVNRRFIRKAGESSECCVTHW